MQHILQWLEEKNPLLALSLCRPLEEKEFHFPKTSFLIPPDVEVVYIDRVQRCFEAITPFLERGGRVVFVEGDRARLYAFLHLKEFVVHNHLTIIAPEEPHYQKVAWENVFRKPLYIGPLTPLKEWVDGIHMNLSEYRLLGEEIIPNMEANLLYADPFIDGRLLKDVYQGVPAVIAAAGPSLEKSFSSLKQCKGKGVIFGVGSAIPRLQQGEIPFDYGVSIDPNPPPLQKGSFPLFYQGRMSHKVFREHTGKKIWMGTSQSWPIEPFLYQQSGIEPWDFPTGWNAGTFAVEIASFLGCSPIIVLGMDGGERVDLKRGVEWLLKFPNIIRGDNWLVELEGKTVPSISYTESRIDRTKVVKALEILNDFSLQELIQDYLSYPDDRKKLLLEIALMEHPLYTYFLEPLWKLFSPLYRQEDEFLSALVFYQRALAWQDRETFSTRDGFFFQGKREGIFRRTYPTGEVYLEECYKRGKREGRWVEKTKEGVPLSIVDYKEGLCHGSYLLYHKKGEKIREGNYREGEREGDHTLYNRVGEVVWESK